MKIELTEQEAQQFIDVCDIATKAGGLQIARVTIPLVDKLVACFNASNPENPPEPENV